MPQGRRPDLEAVPSRQLQTQRAFRRRRAEQLAGLQERVQQLEAENATLRESQKQAGQSGKQWLPPDAQPARQEQEGQDAKKRRVAAGSRSAACQDCQHCREQSLYLKGFIDSIEVTLTTMLHSFSHLRNAIASDKHQAHLPHHAQDEQSQPGRHAPLLTPSQYSPAGADLPASSSKHLTSATNLGGTSGSQLESSNHAAEAARMDDPMFLLLDRSSTGTVDQAAPRMLDEKTRAFQGQFNENVGQPATLHAECCFGIPGCVPPEHCPFKVTK